MARVLLIAVAGALACHSAGAPAQRSGAADTVSVLRYPTGLHSLSAPDFDVTVWPDGLVVIRTRSYRASVPVERVARFQRSPAEAAEFREALLPYRTADLTRPTLCGGQLSDDLMMIRGIHVFRITWSGPDQFSSLDVCYDELEVAVVGAIDQALGAIHLGLDGAEQQRP
jgi:hypothetical protein